MHTHVVRCHVKWSTFVQVASDKLLIVFSFIFSLLFIYFIIFTCVLATFLESVGGGNEKWGAAFVSIHAAIKCNLNSIECVMVICVGIHDNLLNILSVYWKKNLIKH